MHASFTDLVPEKVSATVEQSGATRTVSMLDDGTTFEDTPGDRVWTGSVAGDPSQYVQVALTVTVDGVTREVYSGAVRVGNALTADVALEVTTHTDGRIVGARRTAASPGRVTHAIEALPTLAATFWAVLVLTLGAVALQLRAAEKARAAGDTEGTRADAERG